MKNISESELNKGNEGGCDECRQEVKVVVEIGGDFAAWVCLECLRRAVKMLEEKEIKNE